MAAFEALCRREYPAVVRTAFLITSDREEAVDVAQEAFARAFQHWRKVSVMDRPGAWVQRVASNLAISFRRRRRFWPGTGDAPGGEETEQRVEDELLLVEALQVLTPAQRAAVVLRYYADQSVEQAARALGKRPGTIRALTAQGMGRLREHFARGGRPNGEEEVEDALRS